MPSPQVVQGERVVNVIEGWEIFEEYVGEKIGLYQLMTNGDAERFEIRVQTGKKFENHTDELLIKILNFCRKHRYIKVCQAAPTNCSLNKSR